MRPDSHEIYTRRRTRNIGLGLSLAALVAVIFAVSVVKITNGSLMEGYDHAPRASLGERTE